MSGCTPGHRRVLALLAAGVALAAAGCGGGGGSASANGSSDYQKEVAFAHCMRSHGVPGWPDPLSQGGFPRNGALQNSPRFGPAFKICQQLLPPRQPPNAAQEHQAMAQALRYTQCMRSHGFPSFPDPIELPSGGIGSGVPANFDPNSPLAQAADKACSNGAPQGPPHGG